MSNTREHIHIADRVTYEMYGTKGSEHNPNSGAIVIDRLKQAALALDPTDQEPACFVNMITKVAELHTLQELQPNPVIAALSKDWNMDGLDFSQRAVAMYGTSGSETNGKELLQLIIAGKLLSQFKNSGEYGAAYFIDTASHPFASLINTEGEMLARATGYDIETSQQEYSKLFEGKVNSEYIAPFIQTLQEHGASAQLIAQIRNNWAERCTQLEVPADAIGLPDLNAYIAYYNKIGIHTDIPMFLERAYKHIEEKKLPPTIGTLRNLMFSQTGEALAQKLGFELPFVTVPIDTLSDKMGMGELKISDFKALVKEIMNGGRDNRAYFSMLDPMSMGERFLRMDSSRSSGALEEEFERIVEQIPYHQAARMGHNAGISYYAQMLTLGNGAFVFDNYEAGDPHYKIAAASNWRMTSGMKFICEPRGWVRMNGYTRNENSTYGDSPLAEAIYHGLVSDPNGIEKLQQYTDLISANIGQNATVAMDVGNQHESAKVFYIADNVSLAKKHSKEPSVTEIVSVDQARQVRTGENSDLEKRIAILKSEQATVSQTLASMESDFVAKHREKFVQYYLNKILSVQAVAESFGLDEPETHEPITDHSRLLTVTLPEDVIAYMKKQESISYSRYEAKLRAKLKSTQESRAPDASSPLSQAYIFHKDTSLQVGAYRTTQARIKLIDSVIAAKNGKNKELFAVAVNSVTTQQEPDTTALDKPQIMTIQAMRKDIQELITIYQPENVVEFLQGNFESERTTLETYSQNTVAEISTRTGIQFKEGIKIDKNELALVEQQLSAVTKLIEASAQTNFALELADILDSNHGLNQQVQALLDYCSVIKDSIIVTLQQANMKVPSQAKMNDLSYVTQCLATITKETSQFDEFKAKIQKEWQKRNTETGLDQFIQTHKQFLDQKEPLVTQYTQLLLQIQALEKDQKGEMEKQATYSQMVLEIA